MYFDYDYWKIVYDNFCLNYPSISNDSFLWYPSGQNEIRIESPTHGYFVYDDSVGTLYALRDIEDYVVDEDEFITRFTNELYKYLRSMNMTQQKFASLIGVTRPMLNRYLTGRACPNTYIVYKMTQVFGCTINELIFEKVPREYYARGELATDEHRKWEWQWAFNEFFRFYPEFENRVLEWYPISQAIIMIKTTDGLYHRYNWRYFTLFSTTTNPNYELCEYNTKDDWVDDFHRNLNDRLLRPGGLSQDMLAYETGISPSTISYYSNGLKIPSIYNLYKIACVVKCSISELIF